MQVYSTPKEVPVPAVDFANFDRAKMQADEDAHKVALKAYLVSLGYTGKHTGKIYSTPVADGQALYMFADGGRKCALIHLDYGDGYHAPDVAHVPKKVILERIEAREGFNALFAKHAAKG